MKAPLVYSQVKMNPICTSLKKSAFKEFIVPSTNLQHVEMENIWIFFFVN